MRSCKIHLKKENKKENVFTTVFCLKTAYHRYKHKQANFKTEDKPSLDICFILPKEVNKHMNEEMKGNQYFMSKAVTNLIFFLTKKARQWNMIKKT